MSFESYDGALTKAGAVVHNSKTFGSYQGMWVAEVTLPDGRKGLIQDYYGSCSGCDAFEAEFAYDSHQSEKHPGMEDDANCAECIARSEKLAEFGRGYFANLKSADELGTELAGESHWSYYDETPERAAFILARMTDATARALLIARIEKVSPSTPGTEP